MYSAPTNVDPKSVSGKIRSARSVLSSTFFTVVSLVVLVLLGAGVYWYYNRTIIISSPKGYTIRLGHTWKLYDPKYVLNTIGNDVLRVQPTVEDIYFDSNTLMPENIYSLISSSTSKSGDSNLNIPGILLVYTAHSSKKINFDAIKPVPNNEQFEVIKTASTNGVAYALNSLVHGTVLVAPDLSLYSRATYSDSQERAALMKAVASLQ